VTHAGQLGWSSAVGPWACWSSDFKLRRFRSVSCQRSGFEHCAAQRRRSRPRGPVPHEDCGERAATLVDTCPGGIIRARSSQESVPTSHDDTARCHPAPQGGALEPRTKSVARVSQQAASLSPAKGRFLAGIRTGRTLDYVDRIVPPHYSAAPSGDLCTMSKQAFVVQGESGDSVPTTGERPQLPRSSRVRLFAVGEVTIGPVTIGRAGVPMWRQRRQVQSESTSRLRSGAATRSVAAMTMGVRAQASFPQREQMKHDTCNAVALESQALNGRRYGAPRNRFFT
jgi:hypothetical protein